MGKLKKWIVIGAAIIVIAAFLFIMIVNAISATLTAVLQQGKNSEYNETMVCSITGTKTGNSRAKICVHRNTSETVFP